MKATEAAKWEYTSPRTVVFFSSVLWRDFMSAHVLWYEEVEDDCKYEQPDVIDHSVRSDRAV